MPAERRYLTTFCFLILLGWTMQAHASDRVPYRAPRVEGDVIADGRLNEPVWDDALVLTLDYEVRPGENIPPPVDTEVYLAYTQTELYIAFKAYDPDPSQIRARMRARDDIWADDWVAINLDTFNDERNSFLLVCNPFGAQADNMEVDGNGRTWDAIWDSGGRIHTWGYAVEMVIPFHSLRFQRTEEAQVWGVDAIRSYPRRVRHHIGLFPRDRSRNCYLCQAEKLVGFAGVKPGKNLEFDPTVSGFYSEERESGIAGPFSEDGNLEAGLTMRWGVTPNMTFAATANPDFSQIEADALRFEHNEQYAIFYGERRPFFLEGAELFDSSINIVHTRTVANPDWGVKLTGKEGSHAIGFFTARDTRTNLLFPSSEGSGLTSLALANTAGVVRYRRDLPNASTAGFTFTDREADGYFNRLGSVDGDLRLSDTQRLHVQGVITSTEYPAGLASDYEQPTGEFTGWGYNAIYRYQTRDWASYLRRRERSEDFRADLGYIGQVDVQENEAGIERYLYRDRDHWWNRGEVGMGVIYDEDRHGNVLNSGVDYWAWFNGLYESHFNVWGIVGRKYYQGKEFPDYHVWAGGGFRPNSVVYIWTEYAGGDEIDYENARPGKQFYWEGSTTLQLGRHFRATYRFDYEQLTVYDTLLFTARINYVKLLYQFTQRAYLRVVVQNRGVNYNIHHYPLGEDETEDDLPEPTSTSLGGQVLFAYTLNPQTVFYLGYTDNWRQEHRVDLVQTNRTVFAKLGYAWVL